MNGDYPELPEARRWALIAAVAGLVVFALAALLDAKEFYHAYIWSYWFWLGVPIGCGQLLMLYQLVGGAWMGNAGGNAEISSSASINIQVGGAIAFNGATIVMKVGGSSVTISAGSVVLDSAEVKITATGPMAETAGLIGSKA